MFCSSSGHQSLMNFEEDLGSRSVHNQRFVERVNGLTKHPSCGCILQIFDVSLDWVPSEGQSQTMVGVYFIIRAETDTQVVTFNAYWASPLPVTVLNKWPQGWTLNRVFNVKVVAKS